VIAFVNRLELTGSAEELERIYAHAAAFMETQPGFLRYTFVRSRKDASVYFNIAEWVDHESLANAMAHPEFHARLEPMFTIMKGDPHTGDVVGASFPLPA
jgi:heme-degrading monooxygenase HmoA